MKVLVTGGAGLIGSHLVDALLAQGDAVRILDNLEPQTHPACRPAWMPKNAELIEGDLRSHKAVVRALRGVEVVFHQAAFGGFTTELSKYADVNVGGTVRLLEVIRAERLPVRKIVVASSQALYGEGLYTCQAHSSQQPPLRSLEQCEQQRWELECPVCRTPMPALPTPEEKRPDGVTIYALSKAAEERWSLALGRAMGVAVVALRYAVTYGPRQSLFNPYTGVVSIFSTRLLNGLPPVLYEDGHQTRDFIFVEDIVRANLLVMDTPAADGQAFNVGTGRATSVRDLVRLLGTALGCPREPLLRGEFRPGDVRHLVHDTRRLEGLEFRARVSLAEGLAKTVAWIRSQGSVDEAFTAAESGLRAHGVVRSAATSVAVGG